MKKDLKMDNLICKIFGHKCDAISGFNYKRQPTGKCDRCDEFFKLSDVKLNEHTYELLMGKLREIAEENIKNKK